MRYYQFNFGVICPPNVTEESLDEFMDEFIDLVERYDFSIGGGLIEVDETGADLRKVGENTYLEAKKFLDEKQEEHYRYHGVYADTNSKIAEWINEYHQSKL